MIYDVITLGETMLRLSPPEPLRIEQASHYEMHVGGSESNVAVGLARLGLRVAWLSRLTDNALGHTIENAIRAYGVDTSHIVWTNEDRVGLYFYEPGGAPRSGKVIYDRAGSAASRIQPTDLPAQLLAPDRARLGITEMGRCWASRTPTPGSASGTSATGRAAPGVTRGTSHSWTPFTRRSLKGKERNP